MKVPEGRRHTNVTYGPQPGAADAKQATTMEPMRARRRVTLTTDLWPLEAVAQAQSKVDALAEVGSINGLYDDRVCFSRRDLLVSNFRHGFIRKALNDAKLRVEDIPHPKRQPKFVARFSLERIGRRLDPQ